MPLNDIGKEWVAALRSGEYTQGKGKLHAIILVDGNEQHQFCCLGVLSEILVKHFPDQIEKEVKASHDSQDSAKYVDYIVKGSAEPAYNYLNDNLCKLAGFKGGHGGSFIVPEPNKKYTDSLAARNDNGASFEKIATIIEENADQFFGK